MNSFIIRLDQGVYPPHAELLREELGFVDLVWRKKKKKRLISKRSTVFETLFFIGFLLRNLPKYRHAHTIVSIGWSSLFLKLLIKMRVVRCKRFFWLGFFVHDKSFYRPMKKILTALKIDQEYFIVNSESEIGLCHRQLSIPLSKLLCLPYGDFSSAVVEEAQIKTQLGTYYFAGGYTNRDYASLIEAFRQLEQKLLIAGSHLNKDLFVELPPNVEVVYDVPKKQFHTLVRDARACILPLKDATGASGQMVLLNYMKQGKAIIASDMKITREYIEEGTSAILFKNAVHEIPDIVRELDQDEEKMIRMGVAANQQYNQKLGGEIAKQRFYDIISTDAGVHTPQEISE